MCRWFSDVITTAWMVIYCMCYKLKYPSEDLWFDETMLAVCEQYMKPFIHRSTPSLCLVPGWLCSWVGMGTSGRFHFWASDNLKAPLALNPLLNLSFLSRLVPLSDMSTDICQDRKEKQVGVMYEQRPTQGNGCLQDYTFLTYQHIGKKYLSTVHHDLFHNLWRTRWLPFTNVTNDRVKLWLLL